MTIIARSRRTKTFLVVSSASCGKHVAYRKCLHYLYAFLKIQQCIYVEPNYVESYSKEQKKEGKSTLCWKNVCVQTR